MALGIERNRAEELALIARKKGHSYGVTAEMILGCMIGALRKDGYTVETESEGRNFIIRYSKEGGNA